MKWHGRQSRRDAAQSRQAARQVEAEVSEPLRQIRHAIMRMRAVDTVSIVVQAQLKRNQGGLSDGGAGG